MSSSHPDTDISVFNLKVVRKSADISFNDDDVTLTVHPVVVQFALQVVVL